MCISMSSICVNLYLYSCGPRVGPNFAVKGLVLHKTALTLGVHRAAFTSDRLATNLGVPPDSLRFNNALERLTELRKAL